MSDCDDCYCRIGYPKSQEWTLKVLPKINKNISCMASG